MHNTHSKTALTKHYFDDIFNNAASINDAIDRMREKGNVAFFNAQKGVLKEKFKQTTFAAQPWQHEIMHLTGHFSHTPYGEQFAVLAQRNFEQWEEPINRTLNSARMLERNAPHFNSNGLSYNTSESFYQDPTMAEKRQIKDWQAIYACAVGFWLSFKIKEHMKHFENNKTDAHPQNGQEIARLLQQKSLNNTQSMAFTLHVEEALDHLPASLLQLSKAENRALLYIARGGLREYARRETLSDLPEEFAPFKSRVNLTMEKLYGLIYNNIYATRAEQFAHFTKTQNTNLQHHMT